MIYLVPKGIVIISTFLILWGGNISLAFSAETEEFWDIIGTFKKGGPVMYPILLCSVLSLAIILERAFNLRKKKIIPPAFIENLRKYWYRSEPEKAISLCEEYNVSLSRVIKSGLLRYKYGPSAVEKAIEGAGEHEASLLISNLRVLGAIGSIAPMLGFLGTVTGMIRAFNVISQFGTGNPSLVASGISEALVTTAAGLIVGIPALTGYYYFRGRVEKYIYLMEEISLEILEDLADKDRLPQPKEVGHEI
jgi:biopolymer transport protein ExbB